MFKNKRFFILTICLFPLFSGLHAQDNTLDLQKANRLLSVAQERDRVAAEDLEEVKSRRLRLEEDLVDLQDKSNAAAKTEKKKIEAEVKTLRKREDDLQMRRKYANNLLLDVTDILQAAPKKRAKFILEYEKRFGQIKLKQVVVNQEITTALPPSPNNRDASTVQTPKTTVDPIAKLETQTTNPPPPVADKPVVAPEPPKTDTKKQKKEGQKKPKKEPKPLVETVAQTTDEPKQASKPRFKQKKEEPQKPKKEAKVQTETVAATGDQPKIESKSKKKKEKEPKVTYVPKAIESDSAPKTETVTVVPEPQKESKKKKEESKPAPVKPRAESSKTVANYKKYDPKDDVLLTTPTSLDCNLAFDGMDNFTGKKKQETTPIILFAHTDDFMRATMKNKEFVTCEATATRVEGSRTVYLNLTMTILSKDAQRTFGFLDRGALIIFRFINGKKMSLTTNKTDIGIVDVDKGTTTFRAQLAIGETIEMTASELDAVRVSWSVGYEDYEIFDMDVLRNLFKCLDKK